MAKKATDPNAPSAVELVRQFVKKHPKATGKEVFEGVVKDNPKSEFKESTVSNYYAVVRKELGLSKTRGTKTKVKPKKRAESNGRADRVSIAACVEFIRAAGGLNNAKAVLAEIESLIKEVGTP